MPPTQPAEPQALKPANVLILQPTVTDHQTGGFWVHKDYVRQEPNWEVVDHVAPIKTTERFGDVESWADYILHYGGNAETAEVSTICEPFLTWSERGLTAVLDYHNAMGQSPDRCQWIAIHDFTRSSQWNRWAGLADGRARGQKAVLESLEDYAEDIAEPTPADLLTVLRTLRATASATADTELLADGSTRVTWQKQTGVKSAEMNLPPEFLIRIPVLKGHVESNKDGKQVPVLYQLAVRLRASVDDQAHLAFRLSMPNAERVLEAVFADRVAAAQALLGDAHKLYRAAER